MQIGYFFSWTRGRAAYYYIKKKKWEKSPYKATPMHTTRNYYHTWCVCSYMMYVLDAHNYLCLVVSGPLMYLTLEATQPEIHREPLICYLPHHHLSIKSEQEANCSFFPFLVSSWLFISKFSSSSGFLAFTETWLCGTLISVVPALYLEL